MARGRGRPRHPDVLTPAEWRVAEHVRDGRTNAEIAVRLGISVNTVRFHVSHILDKLALGGREELKSWTGEPRQRFAWMPAPLLLGVATVGALALVLGLLTAVRRNAPTAASPATSGARSCPATGTPAPPTRRAAGESPEDR
ncbi:MAG: helix-turn-helix transcriptional regulator [Chloroflexi bacterium]|nr:helix-turn-helix transcriptional regulator [Chloroflexota bacterium]MDA1145229.1 helix-turn-helix transcriptional regulator [Chloroflexota bacterium]